MSDNKTTSNGIGLWTVLFLIFLTLKLAKIGEVADWSWWWVTSPLWIPFAIACIALLVIMLVSFVVMSLEFIFGK